MSAESEKRYITPTKNRPVFTAYCDHFGSISTGMYNDWIVGNQVGETFALHYMDAVNMIHEWIRDHEEILDNYPKSKFFIEERNGSVDKDGDVKRRIVYTISARKAQKYLINK